MRTLPQHGAMDQFVRGLGSAGNSAHRARMSELGQTATFSTAWSCVWNALVNRHSGPNVGYAAVTGPRM